jgi:hypothetical protein
LRVYIVSNKTRRVNLGQPFVASISVKERSNKAYLDFKLTPSNGNYNCQISKEKGRTNPPGFKMIDSKGNVVWSGSFSYG